MKYSETSNIILTLNSITLEKEKKFIKDLRLYLWLDCEIPATEVRKMNDNKIIEEWYRINTLSKNIIEGA